MLACDAWKPLVDDILQMLYHHLTSRMDLLASKAFTRYHFRNEKPRRHEASRPALVLNEASSVLNTIAFAEGIHPFTAYLGCAASSASWRSSRATGVPKLPAYDHDDLGGFLRVKRHLEWDEEAAAYEERAFIGEELRMQVAMEAKWLEPAWQMFVGVRSPLPQADVIDLLTTPGQLDMKIGSANRVDHMFTRGIPSLEFTHAATPPRVLPTMGDLTYFQVNRDSRQAEWEKVKDSLTLAVRVNHKRFEVGPAGNIHGARILSLHQHGHQPATTMQFSLFVVAGGAESK